MLQTQRIQDLGIDQIIVSGNIVIADRIKAPVLAVELVGRLILMVRIRSIGNVLRGGLQLTLQ